MPDPPPSSRGGVGMGEAVGESSGVGVDEGRAVGAGAEAVGEAEAVGVGAAAVVAEGAGDACSSPSGVTAGWVMAVSAGKLGVRVTRASVSPKWPELRTPRLSSARPPSRSHPASLAGRARQAAAELVSVGLFIRELHRGNGALPLPAAELQLPSVALQNPLHDGQPQSAAGHIAGIGAAV